MHRIGLAGARLLTAPILRTPLWIQDSAYGAFHSDTSYYRGRSARLVVSRVSGAGYKELSTLPEELEGGGHAMPKL